MKKLLQPPYRLITAALVCIVPPLSGQPFFEGEISPDFELTNRLTGEPFNLHSMEDRILVLDFFAYWCAPCAFSSPDLEENVQKHYAENGGNPQGLPVQVVSMNLEKEDPASTDAFIEQVGMDLVVDDVEFEAFSQYNDTNGIPLFVVINGFSNAKGMDQWQILLNQAGYPGSAAIRRIIDGIELEDEGDGWRESPWFGWINPVAAPFHFHLDHGWIFIPEGGPQDAFPFFDQQLGWLYTSETLYPFIHSFRDSAWL
ncbi:MAG: redoxin domain-containing protein, partial [Verrucomicrobia bacterium]|nr:redoxin domain-containing protein [Verrucomicrobiota bacterium]